jgi:peptide/nickel transport system substrate-binding protein
VASNGDKTYTITLKKGFKWSNGQPVDAKDVEFGFDELLAAVTESPANWGQFVPGEFPQDVTSVKVTGPDTIVFNLNKAYNPGFFLYNQLQDTDYGLFALPSTAWNIAATGGSHLDFTNPANAKKIYDYLNKQATSLSTWATSPLWSDVDGPYKLKSFNTTNSSYVLTPNPDYGGPTKASATIDVETFTSTTSQFDALKSGSLDVAGLDPTQLAQVPELKAAGYSVFGGPAFGWDGAMLNFEDKTNDFDKVISQTYVRGALQSLIDEPAIVTAVDKGAAIAAYGPTPPAPLSPYQSTSTNTPTYPYGITNAKKLLTENGWKVVPNGTTTCVKPGTAAGDCGAGIPAGTPIKFTWADEPAATSSIGVNESAIVASAAKQVGIDIELQTKTFNFLTSNYDDQNPAATKYTNDWGVNNFAGIEINYYPTQSGIWTPGGGFNFGDFDNAAVNAAVAASVHSANPSAVETENNLEAKELPILFFPVQDYTYAVSKRVGGPAKSFLVMTQDVVNDPQYWYIKKGS